MREARASWKARLWWYPYGTAPCCPRAADRPGGSPRSSSWQPSREAFVLLRCRTPWSRSLSIAAPSQVLGLEAVPVPASCSCSCLFWIFFPSLGVWEQCLGDCDGLLGSNFGNSMVRLVSVYMSTPPPLSSDFPGVAHVDICHPAHRSNDDHIDHSKLHLLWWGACKICAPMVFGESESCPWLQWCGDGTARRTSDGRLKCPWDASTPQRKAHAVQFDEETTAALQRLSISSFSCASKEYLWPTLRITRKKWKAMRKKGRTITNYNIFQPDSTHQNQRTINQQTQTQARTEINQSNEGRASAVEAYPRGPPQGRHPK